MNYATYILDEWKKSISCYRRLNLKDAQQLYHEMINSTGKKRELLREELITGTLYLIPNIINNSLFYFIKDNCYDMNDIINVFNEELINSIDSGNLMKVSFYSQLFNKTFCRSVVHKLTLDNYNLFNDTGVEIEFFCNILWWYVNEYINGNYIDYDTFVSYVNNNYKGVQSLSNISLFYYAVIDICEMLEKNDIDNKKIAMKNFYYLRELFVEKVLKRYYDNMNNINVQDVSEVVINKELEQQILESIFNESLLSEGQKRFIICRYGLIDGKYKSYTDVSKVLGVSIERTRQLEKRVFEKTAMLKPLIELYLEEKQKNVFKYSRCKNG